ncbi:hypothetical protein PILCRDRAFT_816669, partial [Piloderma croceum F 1598]
MNKWLGYERPGDLAEDDRIDVRDPGASSISNRMAYDENIFEAKLLKADFSKGISPRGVQS